MEEWCKLVRYYEEPREPYHLLSACLFYKAEYVKTTNGVTRDETAAKQRLFMEAIRRNAEMYDRGEWPRNTRMRIHMDASLQVLADWVTFLDPYWKHPFFQFVVYDVPRYRDPTNPAFHRGLLGTMMRFHPMFDVNASDKPDKSLASMVSIVDLDNLYSAVWLQTVLQKFPTVPTHTKKFLSFSSPFSMPFYGTIMRGVSQERPRGYWLSAMLTTTDYRFPAAAWSALPEVIESDQVLGKLRYLDALKVALFDNRIDGFYEDFEYGIDEILLNHLVETEVQRGLATVEVVRIKTKQSSSPNFIRKRLLDYVRWNDRKKKLQPLYDSLGVANYDQLQKTLQSKHDMTQFVEFFRSKKDSMDLLEAMQIDQRIVYAIKAFDRASFDKDLDFNRLSVPITFRHTDDSNATKLARVMRALNVPDLLLGVDLSASTSRKKKPRKRTKDPKDHGKNPKP